MPGQMLTPTDRRLVLHLGFHKTGTTSTQQRYRRSAGELATQNWVFQGRRVGPITSAMTDLHDFRLMRESAPERSRVVENVTTSLARVMNGADQNLLISDEMILGRPTPEANTGLYPHAERLLGVVGDAVERLDVELQVVVTVRSQPDFIESLYLQQVQEGRSIAFDEYIESIDLSSLGWTSVLRRIETSLGVRPLVTSYEISKQTSRDLARWFDELLGVDLGSSASRDDNVSLSEPALWTAIATMPMLPTDARGRLRRFLQKQVPRTADNRPRLLSDTGRNRILSAVSSDNERLLIEYLGGDRAVGRAYTPTEADPGGGGTRLVDPVWETFGPACRQWNAATEAIAR